MFSIGDKVRTKPGSFTTVCGRIVALHTETRLGHSLAASVYAGGYESVKIPLSDLINLSRETSKE